jgi:hypothetical protein
MANLEEKIRQHERPKVFVKIEDWEKSIIQKISVRKKSVQKKLKEEEKKSRNNFAHFFIHTAPTKDY